MNIWRIPFSQETNRGFQCCLSDYTLTHQDQSSQLSTESVQTHLRNNQINADQAKSTRKLKANITNSWKLTTHAFKEKEGYHWNIGFLVSTELLQLLKVLRDVLEIREQEPSLCIHSLKSTIFSLWKVTSFETEKPDKISPPSQNPRQSKRQE